MWETDGCYHSRDASVVVFHVASCCIRLYENRDVRVSADKH